MSFAKSAADLIAGDDEEQDGKKSKRALLWALAALGGATAGATLGGLWLTRTDSGKNFQAALDKGINKLTGMGTDPTKPREMSASGQGAILGGAAGATLGSRRARSFLQKALPGEVTKAESGLLGVRDRLTQASKPATMADNSDAVLKRLGVSPYVSKAQAAEAQNLLGTPAKEVQTAEEARRAAGAAPVVNAIGELASGQRGNLLTRKGEDLGKNIAELGLTNRGKLNVDTWLSKIPKVGDRFKQPNLKDFIRGLEMINKPESAGAPATPVTQELARQYTSEVGGKGGPSAGEAARSLRILNRDPALGSSLLRAGTRTAIGAGVGAIAPHAYTMARDTFFPTVDAYDRPIQ